MKILLTGSKGLFGINFLDEYSKKHQVLALYHQNTRSLNFENTEFVKQDIRDTIGLKKIFKTFNPEAVLHAASNGDVDYCQKNKKEAYAINVKATEQIARLCKQNNARLVYFSTNAIYDGSKPPYGEKSKPNPINYYGKTKLEAEQKIKAINPNFNILRLITMYGWNERRERSNPATWVIESLRTKKKIKVVDDVYNNHLYVGTATKITNELLKKWRNGNIFNVAGADCINRYQFAKKVADVFDLDSSLIESVKSSFFQQIAPRPKNTCFNPEKISSYLNMKLTSTRVGLLKMKKEQPVWTF